MNNTFYNYNDLLDFINDIIKNKKIWTKYGLIHSFTISNVLTPLTEGYISLMIRNNNIIQNLSKYVFSLEQFKTVIFSNEIHGIEVYKRKFPLKTPVEILDEWQGLTSLQKEEYFTLGTSLTDELDRFPTFIFPDIITNPLPEELVVNEIINLNEVFRINTGLHKFVISGEIMFNVYFDYNKTEYVITNLSSIITNTKNNTDTINVYIEDDILYCQNKLEELVSIKKYSNYL